MTLEDELGDVVSKARVGLGRTVQEVSQAVGLSTGDIESIEAYRLKPKPAELAKLAEALALDPGKLSLLASDSWQPPSVDLITAAALVVPIPVPWGNYEENCYILGCRQTNSAAIIDPGGATDAINSRLADLNLKLDLILTTHAHSDHIGAIRELAAALPGVRVACHQLERDSVVRDLAVAWEPAKDGVGIALGNLSITPIFTPGHTPGSMCYLVERFCFVGDTLFASSIGRPSNRSVYRQMLLDIRKKLLSLPEETVLLPGHGPATTVGTEKSRNPFF